MLSNIKRRAESRVHCGKKVLSDSQGLVDLPVGLLDFVHHLPNSNCVVLENFHISPTRDGFFRRPPPTPANFLRGRGEYGDFLELHNEIS